MRLGAGGVRDLVALLALVGAGATGCSWLIGVSEDPEVVDGTGSNDAGDENPSADGGAE